MQRMERLAASAGGGNIVTTKSWASMDDDTEAVQRLNVILKVHHLPLVNSYMSREICTRRPCP